MVAFAAVVVLSIKVAVARMAAGWLRFGTRVSIHFQYPETHRLERPG
jgi:hypothetical protein